MLKVMWKTVTSDPGEVLPVGLDGDHNGWIERKATSCDHVIQVEPRGVGGWGGGRFGSQHFQWKVLRWKEAILC